MSPWILKIGILGVASIAFLGACAPTRTSIKEVRDLEQRVEVSRAEGARMDAQMRAMSLSDLMKVLEEDAKRFSEPFNSRAYQEVLRRGPEAADMLVASIDRADRTKLLQLLALRAIAPGPYERLRPSVRIGILTDDLEKTQFFNVWGLPHLYWEDAAKAMIAEGKAAEPALRRLLKDTRPAPVWGDEEATVAAQYQYRVRDYAWALIQSIQGKPVGEIPRSVNERDRLIFKE